jgi:hypothetical protein
MIIAMFLKGELDIEKLGLENLGNALKGRFEKFRLSASWFCIKMKNYIKIGRKML